MARASVTLLGTEGGPAIRPGSPMPTSSLLRLADKTILIDAGLGAAAGVVGQGVPLETLDAIFVTHLHSDHYLELGPLLHTAWTAGLKTPIPVVGPARLARYFDHFWQAMADDIDLRIADEGRPDLRDLVQLAPLAETTPCPFDDIDLSVLRNDHPPIADSFALRFDADGRSVVFSGDTAYLPAMISFAQGTDLLIHEAMLTAGIDALCARVGNGDNRLRTHLLRSHTPAADVGRVARQSRAGVLVLNHLVPCDDPTFIDDHWRAEVATEWNGITHIGRDGMTIEL